MPPVEFAAGAVRTSEGASIATHALAIEVLENRQGRYSVRGYAERMHDSFGVIYLGLDDGDAYRDQSTRVNAAIMSISEADAFAVAYRAGKAFLAKSKLKAKPFTDHVLADVARDWFALPDDKHVKAGALNLLLPLEARCPGDFAPTSGHIFLPKPGLVGPLGVVRGNVLEAQVLKFVREHRQSPPAALLARVIFDVFKQPAEENLLTSTLIGVMMGFLPTVEGNLRVALQQWEPNLGAMQAQYYASTRPNPHQKAREVVTGPLGKAICAKPTPPAVWRTVETPHTLGGVALKRGDKVEIRIDRIMANEGTSDPSLYLVFGGDRGADNHPTHACPGYDAAMGVMLGAAAAVMEDA